MTSRNDAPSWAEQWGTTGSTEDEEKPNKAKGQQQSKKMGEMGTKMKAVTTASMGKAKTAATVGAQKIKSGTSLGIKWVKAQYHKRTSK